MIRMDTLSEMERLLPAEVCRSTREVLEGLVDYFDGAAIDQVSLTELLGGPAYLIERVEDLAAVQSFDEGPSGRVSLLDGASGAFDIAEWVGSGEFARFVAIDSALGGAQYVIPKRVADCMPTVAESIRERTVGLGHC